MRLRQDKGLSGSKEVATGISVTFRNGDTCVATVFGPDTYFSI